MAIELRFDNTGAGMIVVACIHCGEDVGDPHEGLAVWTPAEDPDPVVGAVFHVDYAHRVCEERFQEGLPGPRYKEVAKKINLPLAKLFDALRELQASGHEDPVGERNN